MPKMKDCKLRQHTHTHTLTGGTGHHGCFSTRRPLAVEQPGCTGALGCGRRRGDRATPVGSKPAAPPPRRSTHSQMPRALARSMMGGGKGGGVNKDSRETCFEEDRRLWWIEDDEDKQKDWREAVGRWWEIKTMERRTSIRGKLFLS